MISTERELKKAIRPERAIAIDRGLLRPAITVVKEQADMDHATDATSPEAAFGNVP